jgi:hypothetical protein
MKSEFSAKRVPIGYLQTLPGYKELQRFMFDALLHFVFSLSIIIPDGVVV